jgi:putative SOS response-associated peptidase YedK
MDGGPLVFARDSKLLRILTGRSKLAIMCGRAILTTSPEDLRELFDLHEMPELIPRFNIAPSQPVAVIRQPHRLELLRWGLPSAPGGGINVRVETVARAPAYRSSFRTRRCLVVVDGFYEWKREGKNKQPFLIQRPDKKPFALAGIWDSSVSSVGEVIESFAIITRNAAGPVAALHDRMPVILPRSSYASWLDASSMNAVQLLVPEETELLLRAVSPLVNNPANDDARCLEPRGEGLLVGENGTLF